MESEEFQFSNDYGNSLWLIQAVHVNNIFYVAYLTSTKNLQFWIESQRCSNYLNVDFAQNICCFVLYISESDNSSVCCLVGLSNGDIYNLEIREDSQSECNRTSKKWKQFLQSTTVDDETKKYFFHGKVLVYKVLEVKAITKVENQFILSDNSKRILHLIKSRALPYTLQSQRDLNDDSYTINEIKSFPQDYTPHSFYDFLISLFGITRNLNDFNYIIILLCDNGSLLWYTFNSNTVICNSSHDIFDHENILKHTYAGNNNDSNNTSINDDDSYNHSKEHKFTESIKRDENTINKFISLNSNILSIFPCTLSTSTCTSSSNCMYPHLLCILEGNLTLSCYSIYKSWHGSQIHENKLKFPHFAKNITIWRHYSFLFLCLQELYITHLNISSKGQLILTPAYKISENYTCPISTFSMYDNFLVMKLCNGKLSLFEIPATVITSPPVNISHSNHTELNHMFKNILKRIHPNNNNVTSSSRNDNFNSNSNNNNNNNNSNNYNNNNNNSNNYNNNNNSNNNKNNTNNNTNSNSNDIEQIKYIQLQLNEQHTVDKNLDSKISRLDQEILALTSLLHLLQNKPSSKLPSPPEPLPLSDPPPQNKYSSHPFPALLSSLNVTANISITNIPATYIPLTDQSFPPQIVNQFYQLTVTLTTKNRSTALAIENRILQILWRCTLPSTALDPTSRIISLPILMHPNNIQNNNFTFTTTVPISIPRIGSYHLEVSLDVSFLVPEVFPIPLPPTTTTTTTNQLPTSHNLLTALPSSIFMNLYSKDWNLTEILLLSRGGQGLGSLSCPILPNHAYVSSSSNHYTTTATAAAVASNTEHKLNLHIPTLSPNADILNDPASETANTSTSSLIIESLRQFSNHITQSFAVNNSSHLNASGTPTSSITSLGTPPYSSTRFHQNLTLTIRELNSTINNSSSSSSSSSNTVANNITAATNNMTTTSTTTNNKKNINVIKQSVLLRSNNKEILPLLHAATREEALSAFSSNTSTPSRLNDNNININNKSTLNGESLRESLNNSGSGFVDGYTPSDIYSMPPRLRQLLQELDDVIQILESILTLRINRSTTSDNNKYLNTNDDIYNKNNSSNNSFSGIDNSNQNNVVDLDLKKSFSPLSNFIKREGNMNVQCIKNEDDDNLEVAINSLWNIYIKLREHGC